MKTVVLCIFNTPMLYLMRKGVVNLTTSYVDFEYAVWQNLVTLCRCTIVCRSKVANRLLEMKTFSSNRIIFILLIWICCCSFCESARIIGCVVSLISLVQNCYCGRILVFSVIFVSDLTKFFCNVLQVLYFRIRIGYLVKGKVQF